MKKVFFSIIMILAIIALMPLVSYAEVYTDDFNDGIMNTALWTAAGNYWARPSDNYSDDPFTFKEQNGVLNFVSNDPLHIYGGRKKYDSTWTVDFSRDFKFYAQYNTLSSAALDGSVEIGLHNAFNNNFELWSGAYAASGAYVFDATIDEVDDNGFSYPDSVNAPRDASGVIGISYSKAYDRLDFIGGDDISDVYASIDNFTATYGSYPGFENLHVYLEGDSSFSDYNASFDNFNYQSAVAPEPVSSMLFILGGAAFGIKRFKKKSVL